MKFNAIDHVTLHVADLEGAIQFYETVLELKQLPRPQFSTKGAWFQMGSAQLHLIEGRTEPVQSSIRGCHFAITVPDLDPFLEKFEQHQVEVLEEIKRDGGIRQLFFKDSEGYVLELFYRPSA